MRLFVFEHDKKSAPSTMDLNNPPRVAYQHQEWPKLMYSTDATGKPITRAVADAKAQTAALESGWFNEPQGEALPEQPQLDAASRGEVAAIEKTIAAARKAKAARK